MSSVKSSAGLSRGNYKCSFRKGDRVLVNGSALERGGDRLYPGTVEYIGFTDGCLSVQTVLVGVHLYDNVYSSHNGVYQGKRYFYCPRGHGAMVKSSDIIPLNSVPRKWPVNGNRMFPSYEEIKKQRRLREQLIKESEEKFRKEYQTKRRAQMERSSKSSTLQSISDKDQESGDEQKQADSTEDNRLEELNLIKMKKYFGNDEKAERMAATLRKLRRAFEQGRIMTLEEQA
ncbi:unnamed protein product [Candidula unifasciata]|uniref:CAP-Gly domain-containing protein n=1 Tax=Candidula unifasciata TaxID=100452 RepID=A0A8S4A2D5_9EUPU|nr:unnamed protein product [Candidula unifasciata]